MSDKYENWIPKAEVMERLGCSERTIDRMVEKGKLKQGYRRIPGRRPLPVYDPDTVTAIESETIKAEPEVVTTAQTSQQKAVAQPLRKPDSQALMRLMAESLTVNRVHITDKLFLTIKEASEFSGLPKAYIVRQIHAGALPALKAGGYRIRKSDLEKL